MSGRRFEGRVAIVTGGASGIGRATCLGFARDGAKVTIVDIESGEEVAKECQRSNRQARFIQADVSDEGTINSVVKETVDAFGRVDILVNNAASFLTMPTNHEEWKKGFGVNVFGASTLTLAVVEEMKKVEKGVIVNTTSISAYAAQVDHWIYSATKGALLTLTKCMALDLVRYNIRVNSVSPGYIWTPPLANLMKHDRKKMDKIAAKFHMIPRCGDPEEVANGILFLCSDEASFINATDLHVDGGYLAMGGEGRELFTNGIEGL